MKRFLQRLGYVSACCLIFATSVLSMFPASANADVTCSKGKRAFCDDVQISAQFIDQNLVQVTFGGHYLNAAGQQVDLKFLNTNNGTDAEFYSDNSGDTAYLLGGNKGWQGFNGQCSLSNEQPRLVMTDGVPEGSTENGNSRVLTPGNFTNQNFAMVLSNLYFPDSSVATGGGQQTGSTCSTSTNTMNFTGDVGSTKSISGSSGISNPPGNGILGVGEPVNFGNGDNASNDAVIAVSNQSSLEATGSGSSIHPAQITYVLNGDGSIFRVDADPNYDRDYGTTGEDSDVFIPDTNPPAGDIQPPTPNGYRQYTSNYKQSNGCYDVLSVTADSVSNVGTAKIASETKNSNTCANPNVSNGQGSQIYILGSFSAGSASSTYTTVAGTGSDSASSGESTGSSGPGITCSITFNPLTWLLCPAIDGMLTIVNSLDNLIDNELDINTSTVFGSSPTVTPSSGSSGSYYKAWSSFRDLALGLLFIIGLVVIISQALGFEFLDAYSIRKAMPRLVIAALGITLSWSIMRFMVQFTNDLGFGVRYLIYAPFDHQQLTLSASGQGAALIAGSAAIGALGIFGALSFAATAALAVFVAVLVLIIRQLAITLLIIIAPVAIVMYILPNTNKAFKLWFDSLSKGLLMFPLISAFIASGRVFASVAENSNAIGQLIGFAAYFAPYFLLPLTFRFAGGLIGTLGGFVNDRHKGGFDRLKKYRSQQPAKRLQGAKSGELYKGHKFIPGSQRLAKRASSIAEGATMGVGGHFGIGTRGRAMRDLSHRAHAREAMQNNHLLQQAGFSDEAIAVLALSGGSFQRADQVSRILQAENGWTDDQRKLALNTAEGLGINNTNTMAAMSLMAQNKSRALSGNLAGNAGIDLIRQSASMLSHGNSQLQDNIMGDFAFNSRNAGRLDFGGERTGKGVEMGIQRTTAQQIITGFGAGTNSILNDTMRDFNSTRTTPTDPEAWKSDRSAAVVTMAETMQNLASANADNRDLVIKRVKDAGVDFDLVRNTTFTTDDGKTVTSEVPVSVEEQLVNLASGWTADGLNHRDAYGRSTGTAVNHDTEKPVISARELQAMTRSYGSATPFGVRGGEAPIPPGGDPGGAPKIP